MAVSTTIFGFTAQRIIYNYLIVNLILFSYLLFKPHSLAPVVRNKNVSAPICIFLFAVLALFLRDSISERRTLQESVPGKPEERVDTNLEYLKWKCEMHKLERDFYLSLASMLAQALVVGMSYWIEKFDSYCKFKDQEEKARKSL